MRAHGLLRVFAAMSVVALAMVVLTVVPQVLLDDAMVDESPAGAALEATESQDAYLSPPHVRAKAVLLRRNPELPNAGIMVEIQGRFASRAPSVAGHEIRVYGRPFADMPLRMRFRAAASLPYPLVHGIEVDKPQGDIGSDVTLRLHIGAGTPLAAQADALLRELAERGDRPCLLEVAHRPTGRDLPAVVLTRAFTRPSALRKALLSDGRESALVPGPVPRDLAREAEPWRSAGRGRAAVAWVRWWAWPVAFCLFAWWVALFPRAARRVLRPDARRSRRNPERHSASEADKHSGADGFPRAQSVPGLAGLGHPAAGAVAPADGSAGKEHAHASERHEWLPPRTRLGAFRLGRIAASAASATGEARDAMLREASKLCARPGARAAVAAALVMTLSELEAMEARIDEMEHASILGSRLQSVFTCINLVWALSAVGIAVTVGPAAVAAVHASEGAFKPAAVAVEEAAEWFLSRVAIPVAVAFDQYGVFEAAAWACAAGLILWAQAARPRDAGRNVALLGAMLAAGPCWGYSYRIAWRGAEGSWADPEAAGVGLPVMLYALWASASLAPLAVATGSAALAYASVVAAFAVLGLSPASLALSVAVFQDAGEGAAMPRVAATAALILAALVVAHNVVPWAAKRSSWAARAASRARVFSAPVAVVGTVCLHVALLVTSSIYFDAPGDTTGPWAYALRNALALLGFAAAGCAGASIRSQGMVNATATAGAVWLLVKYTEMVIELEWSAWVLALTVFVSLFCASLWLSHRPAFVRGLLRAWEPAITQPDGAGDAGPGRQPTPPPPPTAVRAPPARRDMIAASGDEDWAEAEEGRASPRSPLPQLSRMATAAMV